MKTKLIIRQELKQQLEKLSVDEIQKQSHKLSQNLNLLLSELHVIEKKTRIGVFSPIKQEPLWYLSLDEEILASLAFPTMANGEMIFKQSKLSELEESLEFGFSIQTPKKENQNCLPEVIVVPGLGFTAKGERIGRGKGHYDQYLENKKAILIGICFDEQIRAELPREAHDVKMNFVVTDRKIYRNN